jgi:hypothetical protein
MSKLPILKGQVTEVENARNTFNDFPVKALNQQTATIFFTKSIKLHAPCTHDTLSIYCVEIIHLAKVL